MNSESFLESSDVRWDTTQRRPSRIRGEFTLPAADSPDSAILALLSQHADELQLPHPVEESLRVVDTQDTPTARVVRFEQQYQGIPVLDTEVVVVLDNDQRVRQLDLAFEKRAQPTQSGDEKVEPDQALRTAIDSLGAPTLRGESPTPSEVYYPAPDGLRLAYLVLVPTQEPPHDWRTVVDAYSGDILEQRDILFRMPDGQGLVFDPNPVVTANNDTLRDPDATAGGCGFAGTARATIDAQRVTRTLRDITQAGSVYRLEGPFVRMQNFEAPATTFPEEANQNNFNYSSGDERFECVNVYYHIDTFQRYLQNPARGPSITTAHDAQIPCDPHAGSGPAFFSPIDGGLHFSDSGPCRPDRAEDGHVMVHEYGHAIQNNQVPTWGGTNPVTMRQETRAMGEGFGDTMACVFFADHGGGYRREVFEQWIFGDVGGLRRVDGTKVYTDPGDPADPWAPGEHANGEIWSAALWNIYRAIGGDSMNPADRQAARDELIKTVVLSHHRLAGNASMPDGAEAVMIENAALDHYRGRHLMQMLDSFHARGLLVTNPNADLTISDGATFWNSPDLWIRNSDDGGTTHQEPEFGQDNWFYARVRNQGTTTARAFVVTFNVKPWAGTEFVYPNDFIPCISAAVGFELAPGATTVVKAKWPQALVPAVGTHACWLASVYTPTDLTPTGAHVWEHNNLAQKNLTVVDLSPNDSLVVPVQLGNLEQAGGLYRLEVSRPKRWTRLPVSLVHKDPEVVRSLFHSAQKSPLPEPPEPKVGPEPIVRFLESTSVQIAHRGLAVEPVQLTLGRDSTIGIGAKAGEPAARGAKGGFWEVQAVLGTDPEGLNAITFEPGTLVGFPVVLAPRSPVSVGLKVSVLPKAEPGEVIEVDLLQRNVEEQVVGAITIQINVVDK